MIENHTDHDDILYIILSTKKKSKKEKKQDQKRKKSTNYTKTGEDFTTSKTTNMFIYLRK